MVIFGVLEIVILGYYKNNLLVLEQNEDWNVELCGVIGWSLVEIYESLFFICKEYFYCIEANFVLNFDNKFPIYYIRIFVLYAI